MEVVSEVYQIVVLLSICFGFALGIREFFRSRLRFENENLRFKNENLKAQISNHAEEIRDLDMSRKYWKDCSLKAERKKQDFSEKCEDLLQENALFKQGIEELEAKQFGWSREFESQFADIREREIKTQVMLENISYDVGRILPNMARKARVDKGLQEMIRSKFDLLFLMIPGMTNRGSWLCKCGHRGDTGECLMCDSSFLESEVQKMRPFLENFGLKPEEKINEENYLDLIDALTIQRKKTSSDSEASGES